MVMYMVICIWSYVYGHMYKPVGQSGSVLDLR